MKKNKPISLLLSFTIVALVLSVAFLIFGLYKYKTINDKRFFKTTNNLNNQINILNNKIDTTASNLATSIAIIEENLSLTKSESQQIALNLSESLSQEQAKILQLQEETEQLGGNLSTLEVETEKIGGTIGSLEKLMQTDSELLYKYSKIFFLNEHYVPSELSEILNKYLYSERKTQYIHTNVLDYLTKMIDDALASGEVIYVKSAYRSFNEQSLLNDNYVIKYGSNVANQFSADQGYSEHQLGTTVDLITTGLSGSFYGFENTSEYTWLLNNAHRYGFIESYPIDNKYYIYEPWHWRFVGIELATLLKDNNMLFYDMNQADIDEYLINIFDQ